MSNKFDALDHLNKIMDDYNLTIKQICKLLCVSERTVKRWLSLQRDIAPRTVDLIKCFSLMSGASFAIFLFWKRIR